MFRFAHLSDPHIGPLPPPGVPALLGKRVLGYLSWHTRRKAEHRPEVLEALLADLQQSAPDHVAVTGDVTNIALPQEFELAAAWLSRLGPAEDVTVIPGNHETYVAVPWEASLERLAPFMAGDAPASGSAPALGSDGVEPFPFVRCRGPVAFVGVSTALPTPPFRATGRIGAAQLERLEEALAELGRRGLFRVLLVHHPPHDGAVRGRKRLLDAPALRGVLSRAGAEIILHGHSHRQERVELAGAAGSIPVLGVASASACHRRPGRHARYHLCRLTSSVGGWRLEVSVRGLTEAGGRFVTEEDFVFDFALPQAAAS